MSLTHRIQILDFISECPNCTRLWSPAWWFEKFSSLHLLMLFYLIMVWFHDYAHWGAQLLVIAIVLEMAKILWYWFLGNRWCVVMVLIWNFEGFRKILLFNSIFWFLPDGFHHWGGYCGSRIVFDTLQILRVLRLHITRTWNCWILRIQLHCKLLRMLAMIYVHPKGQVKHVTRLFII